MSSPVRLSPGDPAPDFTLPTDSGDQVSLAARDISSEL